MKLTRAIAISLGLFAAIAVFGATSASAAQHRYAGPHPLPEKAPGVFCYIEAPHVHVYAPEAPKVLYRDYDGWYHFVGDPSPYGYEGPKHAYHGAHPIAMDARVEVHVDTPAPEYVVYCYLEGPHYHPFEPVIADFEVKGDVYWYVGDYPDHFHEHRPRRARINRVYASLEYERPVVVVEPPRAYVDVLVDVGGPPGPPPHARGRARGRGHVGGGVRVEVPVPSVEVRGSIGIGTSVREGHGHRGKFKKHKKYKKHKHRGRKRGHRRDRTEVRIGL